MSLKKSKNFSKKMLLSTIIAFLLLTSLLIQSPALVINNDKEKISNRITKKEDVSDFSNESWLEEINGIRVLNLEGTYYEMGFQHGMLLSEDCLENLRAYQLLASELGFTHEDFEFLWNESKRYVPKKYKNEMQGMADALDLDFEQVAIANVLTMWVHCSGFSVWGSATESNNLIHGASLDFPLGISDPLTGQTLQDNFVLILREPDNAYASLDPSYAGLTGSVGGINEQGISTNVHTCWSLDETNNGTPMVFRQRKILDESSSAKEALNILNKNTTKGWNFILSDSETPVGYAIEQTANEVYTGTWNSKTESNFPFWQIDSVVRRTNIFINRSTAETQRMIYNPTVLTVLGLLFGVNNLGWSDTVPFVPWTHYKVLSNELEEKWGSLNLENSMNLFREVYNGNTSLIFNLFQRIKIYNTLHQWVATPENGDMLLSVAREDVSAFKQPVHHLNLYDLIEYEP